MKILFFSPNPLLSTSENTGYGTHMRETIFALKQCGHEVEQLIIGDAFENSELKIGINKSPFKLFLKFIIPGFFWRTLKEYILIQQDKKIEFLLEKIIIDFKPDAIYERSSFLLQSGCIMSKKHAINYYVEVNAPFSEEVKKFEVAGSLFDSRGKKSEGSQLVHAKKIFTVSTVLKNHLVYTYAIDKSKIIVIPNCVNPKKLNVDEEFKKDFKKKYAILDKTLVIGFVGSIFPYHGVDLLINAFSDAKKKITELDLKLLIVGDGYVMDELKTLASKNGTENNVIFTDSVSHSKIFTYIDLMDITVMAKSNWYGSPVKIFEYGAKGKSIIAPDVAPVREVMVDNEDGLLVKPFTEDISDALCKLILNPELRKRFGDNFKNKVLSGHTWDKAAEKILKNIIA